MMIPFINRRLDFSRRRCYLHYSYHKIRLFLCVVIVFVLCMKMIPTTPKHEDKPMDFDGFDNENGAFSNIVPNIIHLIRFNKSSFSFIDITVIRAAHLSQKPDAIYIHTNMKTFEGKYWNQLQTKWPDTYKLIILKPRELPRKIFNHSISEQFIFHHASDIVRYRLLKEYGGIYLDNDVFLVHSLNKYRKYEMTIEWNYHERYMGNMLLIAHKDARFLRDCIETFRDYRADLWYYNGGELPTTAVFDKHPEFVHRVNQRFGTDIMVTYHLYNESWSGWKQYDAFHLLTNHRNYLQKENYERYPELNEDTILDYNFTFGEMARLIYYG